MASAKILVGVGNPGDVGIDEEEEHDEDGHEVHVDEKEDASVVEAPALSHAAGCIEQAGDGDQYWQNEQRGGMVAGKMREAKGGGKAEKDERTAAHERVNVRVEEGGSHAAAILWGRLTRMEDAQAGASWDFVAASAIRWMDCS